MKNKPGKERTVIENRQVIAERQLQLQGGRGDRSVTVRFMRPELEAKPGGVWICVYEISGLPRRRRLLRSSAGVDDLQALLLALQAARQDLRVLRTEGLRLTWEGQDDMGFPTLTGDEASVEEWRRQKFRVPRLSKVPTYRI